MRIGLQRVRCQMRAADEIGFRHLQGMGESGDMRPAVQWALAVLHHGQERRRKAGQSGKLHLALTAPSAQRTEPRADGDLIHGRAPPRGTPTPSLRDGRPVNERLPPAAMSGC